MRKTLVFIQVVGVNPVHHVHDLGYHGNDGVTRTGHREAHKHEGPDQGGCKQRKEIVKINSAEVFTNAVNNVLTLNYKQALVKSICIKMGNGGVWIVGDGEGCYNLCHSCWEGDGLVVDSFCGDRV